MLIEEESVEATVEIVVTLNIARSPHQVVALLHVPKCRSNSRPSPCERMRLFPPKIGHDEIKNTIDRPFGNEDSSVHEAFT